MVKRVGHVDFVIANGDLADGLQKKSIGKYVITSDLHIQVDHATQLLAMIDCKKFYLTQGTEYHTMEDRPLEQAIAEKLTGMGRDATYASEMIITADWARIHASHNIPVSMSTWQYRTTPLARDLLLYELNKDEYGSIHLIVRSHAHYYVSVDFGHKTGVITPCWQVRTPYASKKDIVSPTKIGYIVAEINKNKTITLQKQFYDINHNIKEATV